MLGLNHPSDTVLICEFFVSFFIFFNPNAWIAEAYFLISLQFFLYNNIFSSF